MSNFEKIMHEQTDNIIETSKINDTKKELIQNLSNMNYYGDETYFTQGAFVHVVGLMYLKNQLLLHVLLLNQPHEYNHEYSCHLV